MVKFHNFHQTVQEYYCRGKDNLFPTLISGPQPDCSDHDRLRFHGFYTRNALTFYGTFLIVIQRYFCPSCKHTVSLLPSFLAPRFQYTLTVIFFTLFRMIISHLPLEQVARLVGAFPGHQAISHQHLVFYRKRLITNLPLILRFLGSKEIVFSEDSHTRLQAILHQICWRPLPVFHLEYFWVQARSLLSKS
jgi:transposase-like protein